MIVLSILTTSLGRTYVLNLAVKGLNSILKKSELDNRKKPTFRARMKWGERGQCGQQSDCFQEGHVDVSDPTAIGKNFTGFSSKRNAETIAAASWLVDDCSVYPFRKRSCRAESIPALHIHPQPLSFVTLKSQLCVASQRKLLLIWYAMFSSYILYFLHLNTSCSRVCRPQGASRTRCGTWVLVLPIMQHELLILSDHVVCPLHVSHLVKWTNLWNWRR